MSINPTILSMLQGMNQHAPAAQANQQVEQPQEVPVYPPDQVVLAHQGDQQVPQPTGNPVHALSTPQAMDIEEETPSEDDEPHVVPSESDDDDANVPLNQNTDHAPPPPPHLHAQPAPAGPMTPLNLGTPLGSQASPMSPFDLNNNHG